jgi:hypothetical protein
MASLTPAVTSISPTWGTSVGGTTVTLTGTGFGTKADLTSPTSASDITVLLNGIDCEVMSLSATEIKCVTGSRGTLLVTESMFVTVADKGFASTGSLTFKYIDLWSSPWTWGGLDPPIEGDSVVIPAGQNIRLDVSPPQLFLVLIEGRLEFDSTKDLSFDASYIFIRGENAHFQVRPRGSPKVCFLNASR